MEELLEAPFSVPSVTRLSNVEQDRIPPPGKLQEENRKCLKALSMEVKEKLVEGPRRWPDTRRD
jgi:hypothetical protein